MTRCKDCKRHGNGWYTLAKSEDDGNVRCLWCETKHVGKEMPTVDENATGVVWTSFMDTMRRTSVMRGVKLA